MPGAGKSTAARVLRELGALVIDADKIAHEVLKKDCIKNKISLAFDGQIVDNNEVDRSKLAQIVFADPAKRKQLEDIIHPEVITEIKSLISNAPDNKTIILDVPLLHESGLDRLCDQTILITADFETRLTRVVRRGWTKEELHRRDKAIKDRIISDKCSLIINNSSIKDLENSLKKYFH